MSDNNKKFMDNKTIDTVTTADLIVEMLNNTGELKGIDDVSATQDAIDRVMILNDIDEVTAEAVSHLIRFWNKADKDVDPKDRKPITLLIDSPGGWLEGGLMIADSIRLSKTPVHTVNMGIAYSAGLLVFITGHRRYCYPSASFLFHEGSTVTGMMDAGKFRNYAEFYEQAILRMKKYFLEYTDMTEELYQEKKKDDWWFFAEEAIDLGFCDEILEEFI